MHLRGNLYYYLTDNDSEVDMVYLLLGPQVLPLISMAGVLMNIEYFGMKNGRITVAIKDNRCDKH